MWLVPAKREQNDTRISSAEREEQVTKAQSQRNVPRLRFLEFKGEWEKITLGEIGDTFNGLTGKSGSDFGHGSPYITYKSIFDNAKIDLSRVEYVEITDAERKKKTQTEVQYGDVFFTTSSETPNEVGMSSVLLDNVKDCYLNSFCFGYRLKSLKFTLPEYMRFYLRSQTIRKKMYVLAQGSTRFNISKGEVMKVSVMIPTVEEQHKIAVLFSLIDERIATQNKIIEKLETLIKGIVETVISSQKPNTLIKNCLECNSSTLQESQVAETGTFPVYGATDISGYTETAGINGESILIIKDGSGVGTVKFVSGEYSYIGTLNSLTAKDGYCLKYIYFALQRFSFEPYKTGMAIPHIYFKDYGKAKIYCPSFSLQTLIAQKLSLIENKMEVEKRIILCYQLQRSYLLSRMFI